MNEDVQFDVVVPDIPLPQEVEKREVVDEAVGSFKFAFVGSGQGGSRIAACFHKLGYRRVCVVNTAEQDLATIKLPDSAKLNIGQGGAGKDPKVAAKLFADRKEDVLDFMFRNFGPVVDRVFVTVGAGGGTGAGTALPLIDTALELQTTLKSPSTQVGVIVALPKNSEGRRVNANAFFTLSALLKKVHDGTVSPLIVVDNERISSIYPGLAVDPFWDTANTSVCALFHLFNNITTRHSSYTTFDSSDLKGVLDSGLIVFGATPMTKWDDATDISRAVRDNLKRNILSGGLNLTTGQVAGCVIIGSKTILTAVPHENLDHAFDQLTRLLKPGSTVHRGIYSGNKDNLVVYTVIGGMSDPTEKLEELRRLGDITHEEV